MFTIKFLVYQLIFINNQENMVKKKKIIFENILGYTDFFNKIIRGIILKILHYKKLRHLKKYPMLVTFAFDEISNIISLDGLYEKRELETFFLWIKSKKISFKKGFAIDVGANIGNHTLYFSKFFKKVFSFEANKDIFQVLNLNSRLKSNIKVYNYAASDQNKKGFLDIDISNISGSGLSNNIINFKSNTKCKKLDSLFKNEKKIQLIKIDVEGKELEVLLGAKNILLNNMPIILFEHNLQNFDEKGNSKCISYLSTMGYKTYATISHIPSVSVKNSFVIKLLKNLISFFFYRMKMVVRIETDISPNFYPFIVAIPEWLEKKLMTSRY
jgi:FkbM family methyltransferase